jgi:RNA recognition motif-containing protein
VEETTCLRVSCLSNQLSEEEFYARFARFGRIARTFLPKNYETGEAKGYGYVTFVRRKDAARAMEMMDRKGFDNLIMRVAWDERNLSSTFTSTQRRRR